MATKKYGVVYTPKKLADFVAELLYSEISKSKMKIKTVLDPSCGEGALLTACDAIFSNKVELLGIDVDNNAMANISNKFKTYINDTILPYESNLQTHEYWIEKFSKVSAIIANPPWSSEKIYSKQNLNNAGFSLINGQYNSYVLFIELAYKLLEDGGYFAFIIPDSIFESQNELLRKFLLNNTQIKVIARLGEKIFPEVNRATTVIICKKEQPPIGSKTKCFRLSTEDRKMFLTSNTSLMECYKKKTHSVLQKRFLLNELYNFDIDTREEEEALLHKMKMNVLDWNQDFVFGRGVEVSKSGNVVYCQTCGLAQGYKKSHVESEEKVCVYCKERIHINLETIQKIITSSKSNSNNRIYVGENIKRYKITGSESYIEQNVRGIDYKDLSLYNPPKILIRKTGLGIYGVLDYTGSMTTQSVYILRNSNKNIKIPLEYYLAIINSRVIYYYYLKVYGENEWKSHPYLTKKIIFSLPIKKYVNSVLDNEIIKLAKELMLKYDYNKDIKLESLIMDKYNLTENEKQEIINEINNLPNLGAVNTMKINGDTNV